LAAAFALWRSLCPLAQPLPFGAGQGGQGGHREARGINLKI